ncbi:hypothetical protein ACFO0M_18665 [Micromonospora mangrovi]|uniref:Secreted protein n=2 Tax=Micromonospora TaxID=1873 RepID=A0AAU7M4Q9_9ACTN
MIRSWRRTLLAAALSLATVATGLTGAAPASAEAPIGPASGTFTLTGDPDDPITRGQSFSFSTASGMTASLFGNPFEAQAQVKDPVTGVGFFLALAPVGGPLVAGTTYTGATAWPFMEGTPGMILNGNGATCDGVLTGSFTLQDITWGPYNYLEKLDATFEQHCAGAAPAARGEVHLTNPPGPPALNPQIALAPTGTITQPAGTATVRGTLTCGQSASVNLTGSLVQSGRVGWVAPLTLQCVPGQAVPWSTTTAAPPNGARFRPGDVEVRIFLDSRDPFYDEPVRVTVGPVTLPLKND